MESAPPFDDRFVDARDAVEAHQRQRPGQAVRRQTLGELEDAHPFAQRRARRRTPAASSCWATQPRTAGSARRVDAVAPARRGAPEGGEVAAPDAGQRRQPEHGSAADRTCRVTSLSLSATSSAQRRAPVAVAQRHDGRAGRAGARAARPPPLARAGTSDAPAPPRCRRHLRRWRRSSAARARARRCPRSVWAAASTAARHRRGRGDRRRRHDGAPPPWRRRMPVRSGGDIGCRCAPRPRRRPSQRAPAPPPPRPRRPRWRQSTRLRCGQRCRRPADRRPRTPTAASQRRRTRVAPGPTPTREPARRCAARPQARAEDLACRLLHRALGRPGRAGGRRRRAGRGRPAG